jgi:Helix-turn-helix
MSERFPAGEQSIPMNHSLIPIPCAWAKFIPRRPPAPEDGRGHNLAPLFADRAQRTSGKASGFSQQYISSLEQGQRNPTVITLYELAVALGVNHIELVKPPRGRRR